MNGGAVSELPNKPLERPGVTRRGESDRAGAGRSAPIRSAAEQK
jgi:hypothetical protein